MRIFETNKLVKLTALCAAALLLQSQTALAKNNLESTTPVTVLTADDLRKTPPEDISQFLNTMPNHVQVAAVTKNAVSLGRLDAAVGYDFTAGEDLALGKSDASINLVGIEAAYYGQLNLKGFGDQYKIEGSYITNKEEDTFSIPEEMYISAGYGFLSDHPVYGSGLGFGEADVFGDREVIQSEFKLAVSTVYTLDLNKIPNPFKAERETISLGIGYSKSSYDSYQFSELAPFSGYYGNVSETTDLKLNRERLFAIAEKEAAFDCGLVPGLQVDLVLGVEAGFEETEARIDQTIMAPYALGLNQSTFWQAEDYSDDRGYVEPYAGVTFSGRIAGNGQLFFGAELRSEDVNVLQRVSDGYGRFPTFQDERETTTKFTAGLRFSF